MFNYLYNFFKVLFVGIILILLLPLASCDNIKEGNYLIPVELPDANKKVLIEDFTGMKCPNCPKAASAIDSLKKTYGDNIVAVSIHAGVYSKPSGIFVEDFRTDAGTIYNSEFAIEAYPTGLVDRNEYNNKTKLDYSEWSGAVLSQIAQESPLGIGITNEWTTSSRNLKVSIDVSIFKEISSGLKLQVWLVEDSIVAPQVNGSQIITDYVHKHVFRAALNGTWGEDLNGVVKDAVLNTTIEYKLPEKYKSNHCSIVGFVYRTSDRSVVQVNDAKIIN